LLTKEYTGDKVALLFLSICDRQEALMSVNKAILIGNLGKDPEVRFTSTGRAVARFPIATSEVWTDAEGNRQERTEWHNIIVWGKQGETCGQYLAKGRQVFVEGSIRTRNYDDKSGNKRYVTEIVAQRVRFLGGGGGTRLAPEDPGGADDSQGGGVPPVDDDIPF
jgi:single-strand DNA-binding protein